MKPLIKKNKYTIEAAKVNFDITKPQPQLFVTPDFAHLSYVLEKFADKMALRKGGLSGVEKLINSKNIGSIELSTGIQISGVFSNVIADEKGNPIYIQTNGQTALATKDKELVGHGVEYHSQGFGSPIGKLKEINIAIEDMSPTDLEAYEIYEGKKAILEFEGGVRVEGEVITGIRDLRGKVLLISFKNCTVTLNEVELFKPEWGIYDMAVGKSIVSAYAGPACPTSFDDFNKVSENKTNKIIYTPSDLTLHSYYAEIKNQRENNIFEIDKVESIFNSLCKFYPKDWLLPLEIYELSLKKSAMLSDKVFEHLNKLKKESQFSALITSGLELLNNQDLVNL